MALCRCKEIHSNPKGRKENQYIIFKEPIGYPNTSSICGRKNCTNPGLIWLTEDEVNLYNEGVRIFSYSSNSSQVQVI